MIWALEDLAIGGASFTTTELLNKIIHAPNFHYHTQHPCLGERNLHPLRRLFLQPLHRAAEDQPSQIQANSDEVKEPFKYSLNLKFLLSSIPTDAEVQVMGEELRSLIQNPHFAPKQVLWNGLYSEENSREKFDDAFREVLLKIQDQALRNKLRTLSTEPPLPDAFSATPEEAGSLMEIYLKSLSETQTAGTTLVDDESVKQPRATQRPTKVRHSLLGLFAMNGSLRRLSVAILERTGSPKFVEHFSHCLKHYGVQLEKHAHNTNETKIARLFATESALFAKELLKEYGSGGAYESAAQTTYRLAERARRKEDSPARLSHDPNTLEDDLHEIGLDDDDSVFDGNDVHLETLDVHTDLMKEFLFLGLPFRRLQHSIEDFLRTAKATNERAWLQVPPNLNHFLGLLNKFWSMYTSSVAHALTALEMFQLASIVTLLGTLARPLEASAYRLCFQCVGLIIPCLAFRSLKHSGLRRPSIHNHSGARGSRCH
jgi:hypothetical protein